MEALHGHTHFKGFVSFLSDMYQHSVERERHYHTWFLEVDDFPFSATLRQVLVHAEEPDGDDRIDVSGWLVLAIVLKGSRWYPPGALSFQGLLWLLLFSVEGTVMSTLDMWVTMVLVIGAAAAPPSSSP